MVESEFKLKIPELIRHKSRGVGHIEVDERQNRKIAFYRHESNLVSFSTYGQNWQEIYDKLWKRLNDNLKVLEDVPFSFASQDDLI